MPSLTTAFPMIVLSASAAILHHADAMTMLRQNAVHPMPSRRLMSLSPSALYAGNNRWWDGDKSNDNVMPKSFEGSSAEYQQYQPSENQSRKQASLITPQMEEEVMASARANVDSSTVSRAFSSLIDSNDDSGKNDIQNYNQSVEKGNNSLRDLAFNANNNAQTSMNGGSQAEDNVSNSWDTQQIAIASGATTFFLSPLIIPIIHTLLPPLIPFPSSISFTGAALLGTISYIVALGDPTDQSNLISGKTGGVLGDGVEVSGAVSRIVGRTALQSVQTSAPRLKAAARAMVDYDTTTATLEELQRVKGQLSQTVLELESENDGLRKEVALWQAVEDMSGMYKLEELKEMARYQGLKGYSTDGKNALLRRLIREGILKLDLSPYL